MAAWALGSRRSLGLALYSLVASLSARTRTRPEEARDFVVSVVTTGGQVARSRDPAGTVRAEQALDDIRGTFIAFLRPSTSDVTVWNHLVRDRQYAPVVGGFRRAAAVGMETILDLGANTGATAAYFGAGARKARILAVGPDPESFRLWKRNRDTLRNRLRLEHSAFWPRHEPLSWTPERFYDGREWAQAVERSGNRRDPIDIINRAEAPAHLDADRAVLAKVDIEGAEAEFFATEEDTGALLGVADVIVIELHPEAVDCLAVGMAFDGAGFLTLPAGGFVMARPREGMSAP